MWKKVCFKCWRSSSIQFWGNNFFFLFKKHFDFFLYLVKICVAWTTRGPPTGDLISLAIQIESKSFPKTSCGYLLLLGSRCKLGSARTTLSHSLVLSLLLTRSDRQFEEVRRDKIKFFYQMLLKESEGNLKTRRALGSFKNSFLNRKKILEKRIFFSLKCKKNYFPSQQPFFHKISFF